MGEQHYGYLIRHCGKGSQVFELLIKYYDLGLNKDIRGFDLACVKDYKKRSNRLRRYLKVRFSKKCKKFIFY